MGTSHGDMLFGFLDMRVNAFTPPDPRICSFDMQIVSFDIADPFNLPVHKVLELEPVTEVTHSELYEDQGLLNDLGTEGLYFIADKGAVNF